MSASVVGTVLVIDDDPTVRLIARATLEQAGFAVEEAADGEAGSSACRSARPDIVLLDVNLPGRSGFEVCAELRERGDRTPVLMMTGAEDLEAIQRSYEVGATDFIGKPLNWTILSHRLRYMLRASQTAHRSALLATAVQESAEGIAITDPGGAILYVNRAFERITGYSAAEAVGRTPADLRGTKGASELFTRQKEGLQGSRVWKSQLKARRKDGSSYDQECTISRVQAPSGLDDCFVVVIRDITHERQLERQLVEAQRLEALGTLAGGIAHDFNNLLTPMFGYAEMALDLFPADTPGRKYLGKILSAAERARELVQQILAFSREGESTQRPLSLSALAQEVLALACVSSPDPIDGRLKAARQADVVLGDPSQLQQVLLNLCINAVHAMRGRPTRVLDVRVEPVDVDGADLPHADLSAGPYVRLTVADTGHGMAPDTVQRIFEPFFTTKEPGQGTGIGLAAAHGIVKRHHGAITVRSRLDEGTTFEVYFPRAGASSTQERTAADVASRGKGRVLVVDDDEAVSDVARQILADFGYSADAAPGALDALNAFRLDPRAFDAVITDMAMPGVSGLELTRELLALRGDLPVILCTGYSEAVTPEVAAELGVRELLMKPWTRVQLIGAVQRAIGSGQSDG